MENLEYYNGAYGPTDDMRISITLNEMMEADEVLTSSASTLFKMPVLEFHDLTGKK